ncbi:MAG: ATP synthase subunit I [Wenzhouxiangellaceae bacterium]|nr:ATP synthase subunit I [Wenzhouxiangellaceae bacterium]
MAVWLLRTQALLAAAVALAALWLAGREGALAALAGGGIGIVLTALSALRAGSVPAEAGAPALVSAFYRAMAMKLVIAVVLFTIVAVAFPAWFLPVLAGYVATVVAYWIALWRLSAVGLETVQEDD